METCFFESAAQMGAKLRSGAHERDAFRAALLAVPPASRDAWLDALLGIDGVSEDGPDLPRGCVPYFPCPVDALLRVAAEAAVGPSDVFIDLGSGLGRASAFMHLFTGAASIGVEVQRRLARAARQLAERLRMPGFRTIHGDVVEVAPHLQHGTVFFLYCPFSGARLTSTLSALEAVARTRSIHVATLDLPLPPCSWLVAGESFAKDLVVYRSTFPMPRSPNAPIELRG